MTISPGQLSQEPKREENIFNFNVMQSKLEDLPGEHIPQSPAQGEPVVQTSNPCANIQTYSMAAIVKMKRQDFAQRFWLSFVQQISSEEYVRFLMQSFPEYKPLVDELLITVKSEARIAISAIANGSSSPDYRSTVYLFVRRYRIHLDAMLIDSDILDVAREAAEAMESTEIQRDLSSFMLRFGQNIEKKVKKEDKSGKTSDIVVKSDTANDHEWTFVPLASIVGKAMHHRGSW